jgi:predicted alpha-1,2-mannosidase
MLTSCQEKRSGEPSTPGTENENFTSYVNPFIGTSRMGHVFPGATAPFGMVQLSPQTNFEPMFLSDGSYNKKTYNYAAGYQYQDSTILGFTHTNFSGTGHSDLGDFLVMPTTGKLILNPWRTEEGSKGFYSKFDHEKEMAKPGYYQVHLDSYDINAELTASERVGFHQYTFNKSEEAHIILDMMYNVYHHKNKNVWTFLRVENDSTVTGYRQTKGWARTRKVFFAMRFSKPFKSYGHKKYDSIIYDRFYHKLPQEKNFPEMAGKNIRAYFNFDVQAKEKIGVKMALSSVSTKGAMGNLEAEVPHWDFNKVRQDTEKSWNQELSKIQVETMNESDKSVFYTALYHTNLSPILYEDVDGSYRGLDQNIHKSKGFTNYTIFSLWDTYRALHPLYNLIQPSRNNDMIKSMLAHYDQSVHGMLPIWSHYANENWCMIGYHATSVIADAAVKQVGDFDREHALEASLSTASVPYFDGIGEYIKYHYVPDEASPYSVSKTLEYSYDDWCIAQLAQLNGNKDKEVAFLERSKNFKQVFDSSINFMRPKSRSGSFRSDFDPMDTHGQGYIEGNAWNYGLYVPHEIDNMIAIMGGKQAFSQHLDSLFTMHIDEKYIEKNEDITRDGIIGNYVHGNEPGHHIPYLYNWTDQPHKTQQRVRMIMDTMYGPTANGLCGNDDAGQMSAWYIFSSLGFYPVTPGSPYYAIGSPKITKATIKLENGNTLHIETQNQGKENIYVQEVLFNQKKIADFQLDHMLLTQGGTLIFKMGNRPAH